MMRRCMKVLRDLSPKWFVQPSLQNKIESTNKFSCLVYHVKSKISILYLYNYAWKYKNTEAIFNCYLSIIIRYLSMSNTDMRKLFLVFIDNKCQLWPFCYLLNWISMCFIIDMNISVVEIKLWHKLMGRGQVNTGLQVLIRLTIQKCNLILK